jgi:hypothetical protein
MTTTAAANATGSEENNDDSQQKPIVLDDWSYHDPERDTCAHSKCQRPQHTSLNWVQCDAWYISSTFFALLLLIVQYISAI